MGNLLFPEIGRCETGIYSRSMADQAIKSLCKSTECRCNDIGKACAAERSDDRDPGIAPVRAAFASNRENGMRDARAKVTGGVHSISGRAAERKAESPDEDADDVRAEAIRHAAREAVCKALGENHPDDEHEEERRDELAEEGRADLADGRSRAEDAELCSRIFRLTR